MAKRFTDSLKWQDEWFLSLPNDYRIIWLYMLDNCTIAGRLKKNFKMLNFCCNTSVTSKELSDVFNGRLIDCGSFYFIPKFLKFQYPLGLSSSKPAIIGVRNEIAEYNLEGIIRESFGNDYLIIKDKDKDKDKDIRGVQGGKTKLFPIPGKSCRVKGCKFPAIYKVAGAEYDSYLCAEHMPDEVKAKYTG